MSAAPAAGRAAYLTASPPPATTPWRDALYSVLDLELTGLDPAVDEIVPFATVMVGRGKVRLDDCRCRVVRPRRMLDADTIRIHGPARERPRGCPRPRGGARRQHEVNTRYADAVTAADRHTIYKNGVKEIAVLHGISASFMAKPSEKDIGSSCHIHSSLVDSESGDSAMVDEGGEENDTFRHYLGGQRRHIGELAPFVAPAVNSYKRFATESWAPTSVSRGRDNRTCGFRVVGAGGARALGGQRPRQARLRRPGPLPLPQLRPVRAREFEQVVTDYERRRMFERG